ncbi:5477_t:CDS:2 [Acaulospora colombiana]|uniref:5477_t:CDS:1 n=1 Tax=Acaulospora colombiana TaxID=27376 RepID=A0ACA9PYL5_9GLOM|nr:5477_t:CDS:2 [Acaulospora colombiana]
MGEASSHPFTKHSPPIMSTSKSKRSSKAKCLMVANRGIHAIGLINIDVS